MRKYLTVTGVLGTGLQTRNETNWGLRLTIIDLLEGDDAVRGQALLSILI